MKRPAVWGLAAALVLGSLTAPAVAKRKKPKPVVPVSVDQKLFLRQDSDSCQTPHTFLSAADGPDLTCFYQDAGAPYEVANLVEPIKTAVWPVEGSPVPFVFDTAKKVTGEITVPGADVGAGPVSAGQARLDVALVAGIAGETKEIGAVSETWTTVPGDVHVVTLEFSIDPGLAGRQVITLQLETPLRGAAVGPHTIELDDPASFVVVPILR